MPTSSSSIEGFHGVLKSLAEQKGRTINEFLPWLKEVLTDESNKAYCVYPFPSKPTIDAKTQLAGQ